MTVANHEKYLASHHSRIALTVRYNRSSMYAQIHKSFNTPQWLAPFQSTTLR